MNQNDPYGIAKHRKKQEAFELNSRRIETSVVEILQEMKAIVHYISESENK